MTTSGELPIRLAEAAASFHAIPIDDLPAEHRPARELRRLPQRRIDEWRQTDRDHCEREPFLRYIAAWLDAHRPPPVPLTLIHGDFQSANLLVDDDGEIVILDWELAQIGDPREDLGYFKAVAQAAPPDLIEHDLEGFCARYRELTGLDESQVNPADHHLLPRARRRRHGAPPAGGRRRVRPGREPPADVGLPDMSSVQFGHMMWLQATLGLEAAFAAAKGGLTC